jgi:hypothetical protein
MLLLLWSEVVCVWLASVQMVYLKQVWRWRLRVLPRLEGRLLSCPQPEMATELPRLQENLLLARRVIILSSPRDKLRKIISRPGTLTVALAGGWSLDLTRPGQLQRAGAVDGHAERRRGAAEHHAEASRAGPQHAGQRGAARPVGRRHVPRHVVHARGQADELGHAAVAGGRLLRRAPACQERGRHGQGEAAQRGDVVLCSPHRRLPSIDRFEARSSVV